MALETQTILVRQEVSVTPRTAHAAFGPAIVHEGPVRPEWMSDPERNCVDVPTLVFFPEAPKAKSNDAAVRICRGCPVITDCLHWALDHGERGVWGMTTETQRNEMRRITKEMERTG